MMNKTPPKILEIGAGYHPQIRGDNIFYLDKRNTQLPQLTVHNLLDIPYPYQDETFREIYAFHVLEHICPQRLIDVIQELLRLLERGGKMKITVPYYRSPSAFIDITHCAFFTLKSFENLQQYLHGFRILQQKVIRQFDAKREAYAKKGRRIKNVWLRQLIYRLLFNKKCWLYFELEKL